MTEIIGTENELKKISPMLTEQMLLDILRDVCGQNDITLKQYSLSSCDAHGESYMSTLTHIRIDGTSCKGSKTHSVAVIIKALPANRSHRISYRVPELFRNEVAFYTKVLPKLMTFQKKKNPKHPFTEIPRCFKAHTDGDNDFIIMEDLSIPGFRTAIRQETCNFEHCAEVLKCLGRFHGLSFAMKDQEPDEFKVAAGSLKETYYSESQREWYEEMLKKLLDYSVQAVSIEFPNSIYEQKMKEFSDSAVFDQAMDLVKPGKPHSIIANGDMWIANYLFLYDGSEEQHIKDIRMIDFQLSHCANPVCDVSCFLYSCTTKEFRDSNISDLLRTYHQSLSNMIQDLGSDPQNVYPYKVFEAEVREFSVSGFIMSLEAVPVSMMEDHETPKVELLQGEKFVPLHEILKLPALHNKHKIKRLAENVMYAIDNKHI